MRIDNHMAGSSPPAGIKNRKIALTKKAKGLPSDSNTSASRGDLVGNDFDQEKKDHPKHYVHKRSKIEKAVYVLSTEGSL